MTLRCLADVSCVKTAVHFHQSPYEKKTTEAINEKDKVSGVFMLGKICHQCSITTTFLNS